MNTPGKFFEPLVGYLVDVKNLATGQVSTPHSLMKLTLLNHLRKRTGSQELIEVGTYRGVTAARCSKSFAKVYTIELSKELHEQAKAYLAPFTNVTALQGDGMDHLKSLFETANLQKAVVFLDGHFSGGDTAKGEVPEPGVEELKLLAKHKSKIGAIMIDDFRSFGTEPGFPSKTELINAIESDFKDFDFTVHFDQVLLYRRK